MTDMYLIKRDTLLEIADAIRERRGMTDDIIVSEFAEEIRYLDADTVDGWHIAVRDDGTPPPSGTTGTLTLVYTKGG